MDVYQIQTSINLHGNLAKELRAVLGTMEKVEQGAKDFTRSIEQSLGPLRNVVAEVKEIARAMSRISSTSRKATPLQNVLGFNPQGAIKELNELGQAMGRIGRGNRRSPMAHPLGFSATEVAAEVTRMNEALRGVRTGNTGASRSFGSWASSLERSAVAAERLDRALGGVRAHAPGGSPVRVSGGGGGGRSGGSGRGRGNRGHGYGHAGQHDASALAGLVGVGVGVHGAEKFVETGLDLDHIARNMHQTGASDAQIAEAKRVAEAGSKAFPNLSTLEIFHHINDLRGILGDMDKAIHEAPDILPEFAALKAKAGNGGAKSAVNEIYNAVKSAETANEITGEGVQKHVNSLTRLAFWYGDKLNPSGYFGAQKGAGQMLNLTSDRFRFGPFAALTQEIGQRAGTQFSTFAAKGVAGLRMTGRGLTEAERMGLLDEKTVKWSDAGLVKPGAQFSDIGLDGKKYDRAVDPDLWLYQNVIPKLKAGGVDTDNKASLLRELGQIFTDKNAYGFLFELAAQRPKLDKDWKGFTGTSGDFREYLSKDGIAAVQGVQAQANALMTALSGPAIPGIVENLNKLNVGLAGTASFFEKHPVMAESVTGAGLGVVGGLATAGAVGLTVMAVSTLSLPALAIGAGAAVTIASAIIPWDAIRASLGIPSREQSQREAVDPMLKGALSLEKQKTAEEIERERKRAVGIQGLGITVQNTDAAVKRMGETTGHTGQMAEQATPLMERLGNALIDLARKAIMSEAVVGQISFGGGGGSSSSGGLIQKASLGIGGGTGGGSIGGPGNVLVPTGVSMTDDERRKLGLIQHFESRGRNVPNYRYDSGHTAQGYYQITNSNWRRLAPALGITAPNAMSASREDQTRVALRLLRNRPDMGDWTAAARNAYRRGQSVPTQPKVTAPSPPPPPREIVVHTALHVDGEKLAANVSRHQTKSFNRPRTGSDLADSSFLYPHA